MNAKGGEPTSTSTGTVTVIEAATNTVIGTIQLDSPQPREAAFSPDGALACVAGGNTPGSSVVTVIQTTTNTVMATIETGGRAPMDIVVTPAEHPPTWLIIHRRVRR